jgi:hypothetical protein
MAKYDLLLNVTAVPNPIPSPPKPQGQAVKPWGPTNPTSPPAEQTFQLVVAGVGAVSASAQILVSNDTGDDPSQYNWLPYGDPIAAAGTNNGQASSAGSQAWRHFGAYLTAISGTNASATLRMGA